MIKFLSNFLLDNKKTSYVQEIREFLGKHFNKTAESIKLEQILEFVLLSLPNKYGIEDCAVISKQSVSSAKELVAYIVPSHSFSSAQVHSHLQAFLPDDLLPNAYVPVSTLPLTPDGMVDQEVLTQQEVIDNHLMEEWQRQLQMLPEIEQVAVIATDEIELCPPLHLSNILPNWPLFSMPEVFPEDENIDKISPPINSEETSSDKPALSQGEPIQFSKDHPSTFQGVIQRAAKAVNRGIIYIQPDGSEIFQSYAELLQEAECILNGLRRLGLKPQDKVIFQLQQNEDFLPAFWACILGGFVPVPLTIAPTYRETNSVVNKLYHAWQLLEQPVVFTSDSLSSEIQSLSHLLNLDNFRVAILEDLRKSEPDHNWHISQPDDILILLLTSGSTGMPKAVMQSHHNLLSWVASTAQITGFSSNDISLNWMPLDHVGGIVMFHLRDIYVTSQQIHVPTNFILQEPLRWLDLMEHHRVTITWAPNFAFGLINDCASVISKQQRDLSSLRFILNGGEAIVAQTVKRFLELLSPHGLPKTAMRPAWGMSETCSAVTYSQWCTLDLIAEDDPFVEVGIPIPGFSVRIVSPEGKLVAEGKTGSLQVKGPTITSGYYQNEKANQDAFTEDGWFNTGDLAFLREGRLTITGREKDLIIINGVNFYSHEIEAVVEELTGIETSYTAACAVRQFDNVDKLAIFFHTPYRDPHALRELFKEIRGSLIKKIGINPDYLIPVEKELIPKTAIGKIQRSQLKQQFENGEFDSILKQIDLLTHNGNTLPDWFYQEVWHPKNCLQLAPLSSDGQAIVFLDQLGVGAALQKQLEGLNVSCVTIEMGADYAQVSPNHYRIEPGNPTHYQQLFQDLDIQKTPVRQIIHLWTYGQESTEKVSKQSLKIDLDRGIYSLLFLIQALEDAQGSEHTVRLLVVSSNGRAILEEEPVSPAKSVALGVIKAAPQEMPWLDCRHLDLSLETVVDTNWLLQELQLIQPAEREVAYRHGQRFIPRLQKVEFPENFQHKTNFQQGGFYLISGGLGGIGVEIAQYLLSNYQTKLLLIGQTSLPSRDTWEMEIQQETPLALKLRSLLELETLPGEICYEAVDVCNYDHLHKIVKRVESQWNSPLEGVIHLAGSYHEKLLREETHQSLTNVLRPKILGTWVLNQLLAQRPNSLFIHFSSLTSFFGGALIAAYAGANNFLNSFAHYQRHQYGLQSHCFSWSIWNETGMSRQSKAKDVLLSRGYQSMSIKQGIYTLLSGLQLNTTHLLVGINGHNRNIRRYVQAKPYTLQRLAAYFTTKSQTFVDRKLNAQLQSIQVDDRFNVPSHCQFHHLDTMPLTEAGDIDYSRLKSERQKIGTTEIAPRTRLEKEVANIWQEILGVSQASIQDNFFECGGNSLLGVQLISRLEKHFEITLSPSFLFEAPTIEGLVKQIELLQQEEKSIQQTTAKIANSSIIILKSGGSKSTPLFFVSGGGAFEIDYLMYAPLFQSLDPEQTVYGLEICPFDASGQRYSQLKLLAAKYIKDIQAIQPNGPYLLGGECAGGILAFEIAQQLQRSGQEVALLVLLDSGIPLKDTYLRYITRRFMQHNFRSYMRRFFKNLNIKNKLDSGQDLETAQHKVMEERVEYDPREVERRARLMFQYQAQLYQGRVTLIINEARYNENYEQKAGPVWTDYHYRNDPSLGWRKVATKGVDIHVVPGNHETYIRDYAVITSQVLQKCLNQAFLT